MHADGLAALQRGGLEVEAPAASGGVHRDSRPCGLRAGLALDGGLGLDAGRPRGRREGRDAADLLGLVHVRLAVLAEGRVRRVAALAESVQQVSHVLDGQVLGLPEMEVSRKILAVDLVLLQEEAVAAVAEDRERVAEADGHLLVQERAAALLVDRLRESGRKRLRGRGGRARLPGVCPVGPVGHEEGHLEDDVLLHVCARVDLGVDAEGLDLVFESGLLELAGGRLRDVVELARARALAGPDDRELGCGDALKARMSGEPPVLVLGEVWEFLHDAVERLPARGRAAWREGYVRVQAVQVVQQRLVLRVVLVRERRREQRRVDVCRVDVDAPDRMCRVLVLARGLGDGRDIGRVLS